ncbi:MAG: thioesterase family protein [Aeromicrobium sp.]
MTQTAQVTHTVTDEDTAIALGSGDLPVLGTPRLLAWCEEATCAALDLDGDSSSVCTRVDIEHLAGSSVGAVVTAAATVIHTDGRLVRFQVAAHDDSGQLIGTGEVRRVIVDRERFMGRLKRVGD